MHPTHTIHVEREIEAASLAVWERVQDHANTGSFVEGAQVRLIENGTPSPNGVGAKRELTFPNKRSWSMFKILEEVTVYEAPRTFSYKILSGMPAVNDHLGTLTVEPLGEQRCRLTWHVDFVFSKWHPMGWTASIFIKTFGGVLQTALDSLANQLENVRHTTLEDGTPARGAV